VAGSSDEFSEFVARSYRPLVRTAYLLVGDAGHAEDLVQSALMRTMRSWHRLRATEAAMAYTRVTIVRLAGRWRERRWRGEIPSDALPDRSDGAESSAVAALDVRAALARLPWAQRAVLVLRYFEDLTEPQTAELLGCSTGTVKSRASRGLATLRETGLLGNQTEVHDG
jgi:RNA polymerase sigma-70 factor (sigma-E family)